MQTFDCKDYCTPFPIAILVSRFNSDVTQKLLQGAVDRLREFDFPAGSITVVHVPGAVELPLVAQRFAFTRNYKAIVVLGAIIQGETDHYRYVCEQVSQGCLRVSLDSGIPVIFGVLTTRDEAQALDRVGGNHGHKGKEAVDTACEMVGLLNQLGLPNLAR